jgi:hypothetical protein
VSTVAKSIEELRVQLRGLALDKGVRKMFEAMFDDMERGDAEVEKIKARLAGLGCCGQFPCVCGSCK